MTEGRTKTRDSEAAELLDHGGIWCQVLGSRSVRSPAPLAALWSQHASGHRASVRIDFPYMRSAEPRSRTPRSVQVNGISTAAAIIVASH